MVWRAMPHSCTLLDASANSHLLRLSLQWPTQVRSLFKDFQVCHSESGPEGRVSYDGYDKDGNSWAQNLVLFRDGSPI